MLICLRFRKGKHKNVVSHFLTLNTTVMIAHLIIHVAHDYTHAYEYKTDSTI
jgi:hypothetical protein